MKILLPFSRTFGTNTIELWLADYLDFLRSLTDESVDLIITDPPYGMGWENKWFVMKKEEDLRHLKLKGDAKPFSYLPLAQEAARVLKKKTALFAFTRWDHYPSHFNNLKHVDGLKIKEPLIGQRGTAGGLGDLNGAFASSSEWCLFATKGPFRFRKTQLLRTKHPGTYGGERNKPTGLWTNRFPSVWFGPQFPPLSEPTAFQSSRRIYHPTIKGQKAIEWIILLCSDPGDLVIDPFAGSGTVAAACQHTDRQFKGCDIDPKHFATACKRISLLREDLFSK